MTTSVMSLHDVDVSEFLDVLDTCKGNVFLITRENDRLNLMSQLSRLIGLSRLIEGGRITEACVICDHPEDECRLFRLNMFGNPARTA